MDPNTGQVKEWPSPSGPKSHPYAIAVVDGIVWYNESGQRPDTLVRFDPGTERFTVFRHPTAGAEVRQLLGRAGEVWGAESGLDRLVVARTG